MLFFTGQERRAFSESLRSTLPVSSSISVINCSFASEKPRFFSFAERGLSDRYEYHFLFHAHVSSLSVLRDLTSDEIQHIIFVRKTLSRAFSLTQIELLHVSQDPFLETRVFDKLASHNNFTAVVKTHIDTDPCVVQKDTIQMNCHSRGVRCLRFGSDVPLASK